MSAPHYSRGVYRCEILDQGLTKASTGTVQIVLKIRVLEGVQPPQDVQQYERTVYLAVTDNTMEYVVPKLAALGYTRDSLRFLNLAEPNAHDLRGTEADFFCKHENDRSGELRERWDIATGRSSGKALDLKPPESAELRKLDMLFGRARKANGAAAKPQPAPPPPPPSGAISDDEVPF